MTLRSVRSDVAHLRADVADLRTETANRFDAVEAQMDQIRETMAVNLKVLLAAIKTGK